MTDSQRKSRKYSSASSAPKYSSEYSTDSLVTDVRQLVSLGLNMPMEEITPDLAFGDLPQWDSMGHMEIMLLLEEQYNVEVSADTISALTNIPTICTFLKEHNHV